MSYTWKFFSAGGFDQVNLQSGADLAHLDQLDQKLWVALACPTHGLEFDSRTLELIDADKDGRVRVPEVVAAAKWATSLLKNPDDLLKGSPTLALAAINDATPEGKQILSSAKQILANLGKAGAAAIDLRIPPTRPKYFAATNFNGDGIIPANAAGDEATKAVIEDIMACLGAETDRSGKPGISQVKADAFFADAQAHCNWWKQAEGDQNILPLGEATAAAAAAVKAVKAKVDDYFARCRLAAFDPRAISALNRQEAEYVALAAKELTVELGGNRQLSAGANRRRQAVAAGGRRQSRLGRRARGAASAAIQPLLGDRTALTEADWAALCARAGAVRGLVHQQSRRRRWKNSGCKRLREILASDAKARIDVLIAKDKALEPEANAIAAGGKTDPLQPRPVHAVREFCQFQEFLQPQGAGDLPGGAAVSGPAQLRFVPHGGGRGQTRRDGRLGGRLSGLLRIACARPPARSSASWPSSRRATTTI